MVSRQRDALAGAAVDRQGQHHDRRRLARLGSAPWVRRVTGIRGRAGEWKGGILRVPRRNGPGSEVRPAWTATHRRARPSVVRESGWRDDGRSRRYSGTGGLFWAGSVGAPSRPPVRRALSAPWSSPAPDGRTGRHDVIVRPCPIQTARFTSKERSSAVLFKSVYRLARSR